MTIQAFIEQHAPCLPESTVRAHLKAGRTSAHAMLTFRGAGATAAGGKKGRRTQALQRSPVTGRARLGKLPARFR